MSKKTFMAVAIILLLPLIFSSQTIVKAEESVPIDFKIIMTNPNSNVTYTVEMPLNFTVSLSRNNEPIIWVAAPLSYAIDDGNFTSAPSSHPTNFYYYSNETVSESVSEEVNVSNLSNGIHKLTVAIYEGSFYYDDNAIDNEILYIRSYNFTFSPIYFSVYNTPPPSIIIVSPQNGTYSNRSFPLNFATNEPTSWIGYSLDNQPNETLTGNLTLNDLSIGAHTLAIYSNDTIGNMGKSDTVIFNVSLPTPTPTLEPIPTPTTNFYSDWIPYAIVALVLVGIGASAVYLRKRKREPHE